MNLVDIALQVLAGIFLMICALYVYVLIYAFFRALWHITGHQNLWKPQVGDKVYFVNLAGNKTVMTIREINEKGLRCEFDSNSYEFRHSDRWYKRESVMRL